MQRLGYGKQPYVLYKHKDIDRVHYHIVSIRVNEEGRRIRDFKERKRCQEIMKELSAKYGFSIGKGDRTDDEATPYKGFDKSYGNYAAQIEAIAAHIMKYHFTTIHQFNAIMKSFQVEAVHIQKRRRPYIVFYGIDKRTGKRCTTPIDSRKLNVAKFNAIEQHMRKYTESYKTREKNRAHNRTLFFR